MIKKILLVIGALTISTSCLASAAINTYYLGADAQGIWVKPEYVTTNKCRWGFTGFGGYRWKSVALEGGITGMESQKENWSNSGTNYSSDSKAFNIYLDALFFKAIASNLELKGLLGVGSLVTKTDYSAQRGNSSFSSEENAANVGLRLGAGLQYNISKNWNTSLMYKYQLTSTSFSNMQAVALSLAYVFG